MNNRPNVGNDFVVRPSRPKPMVLQPTLLPASAPALATPVIPAASIDTESITRQLRDLLERCSFGLFAAAFLAIGCAGIIIGGRYDTAHINRQLLAQTAPVPVLSASTKAVAGPALSSTLQRVTHQAISLSFGNTTVQVPADTMSGWVKTYGQGHSTAYIHANASAISSSIAQLAAPYVTAAVNQVTVTHDDGASWVIQHGSNGTSIDNQAAVSKQIADQLLAGNGLHINVPLKTDAYAVTAPNSFAKLLEVDLTSKRMYAYQNGNLVKTFLVTAGAPATPTPIGQFHIWEKVASKDMRGKNPNGTSYFQPHVQWVNYFDHSGDAIHGNYWRPASVFGNTNTSHGCVSVNDDDAKWVYDWAPIGTTVITYQE